MPISRGLAAILMTALLGGPALSQEDGSSGQSAPDRQGGQALEQSAGAQEQESLKVYFETGGVEIGASQGETLDQAARLFREGNPYVMILSGAADTVGPASLNLDLSVARARAVAEGLEARGIPVGRLQVVGRGNSDLPVSTGPGVSERQNRVVEISWR